MRNRLCGLALFFILLLLVQGAQAQDGQEWVDEGEFCNAWITSSGDTIPVVHIRQVAVATKRRFKNRRDYRAYQRMIRNLKVVYPYAVIARERLAEMDSVHATLGSEREKRAYAYQMQQELTAEFEGQMRNLTFSQGRMLFKLIDRETGRTTYSIIKYFRGGMTAGFWQGVAKLFGSNLHSRFDPEGEDKLLNELVILLEEGLI